MCWIVTGLMVASLAANYRAGTGIQQQAAAVTPTAFINRYCAGCHNDKTKTAGLALNMMDVENIGANPEVWEKVDRKLLVRAMPPAGMPRPDEDGYKGFLSYLESSLNRAADRKPDPGRTPTFHRLNRTEYKNSIRDLLALEVEDVDSLLPKDDESYGFDNVNADALDRKSVV